ncbi:MAG TPA: hypothetical protein VGE45_20680 [Chloroflexia bacterium]|jgi:hypothetical protein
MSETVFQVGVEELAFAMGVLGGNEIAGGFLGSILGEKSAEQLNERLIAASHSLASRGYLEINFEDLAVQLEGAFGRIVSALIRNDFSLRCSLTSQGQETLLSYFFHGQAIVEHRIVKVVSSRLEMVPTSEDVLARTSGFYGLQDETEDTSFNTATELATIPMDLLQQIKESAQDAPGEGDVSLLVNAGMPKDVATQIVADFRDPQFSGSVIRVEEQGGELISNEGFLLLKGPQRLWIFEIVSLETPLARVFTGTKSQYEASVRYLLVPPDEVLLGT